MRGWLTLLLALGPSVASAGYIEFHKDEFKREDIQRLESRLIHMVESGDFQVRIDLNSKGGDLSGLLGRASFKQGLAYKLDALREAGLVLTTQVRKGHICMSACTILFALGDRRIASSGSRFMFHAVGIQKAGKRKQKYKELYARRWLRVIRSVDPALASYLKAQGWLLTKRRDWVVRAKSLRKRFGNYINQIISFI